MLKKIIFYTLLIYAILGFVVLPFILKPQILSIVQKESNAKLKIESIYFNPFLFKLNLSGIELSSQENKHLLSLKSLKFDFELYSLFNLSIHVKNFTLEEPTLSVVYQKDKTLNFAHLLKPSPAKAKEESSSEFELPRIILDKIAIVNGVINYEDYTHPTKFDFSFKSMGFELRDIDTDEFNTSSASLRFYSTLGDGGFIDLKNKIIGTAPLKVEGTLDFQASKLYTQWRYMQDELNLEVADGKITLHAEYNVNLDDLNATTIDNLTLSLEKLRVKPKNKHKDVLNLEKLAVSDVTIRPLQHYVHAKKLALSSLDVKVVKSKDGVIDWLEYIKSNSKEVDNNISVKEEGNPVEWDVTLDDLSLEKVTLSFDDKAVKPSVVTTLNEFNLYMQHITLAGEEPLLYQTDMFLNKNLKCSSVGTIKHKVLDIQAYSKCSGIDLVHYRPYIDEIARKSLKTYNIELKKSLVSFDSNMSIKDLNSQTVIDISDANFKLKKFSLDKRSTGEKLVSFDGFTVKGIKLNTESKKVAIKKSILSALNIRTARLKDGSLNIENLVLPYPSKKDDEKKVVKNEKPYSVELKKFEMNYAQIGFNDKLLTPNVKSKIDGIYLSAYDINSEKNSWLRYKLSMRVNEKGHIKTDGSLRHTPLKQKGRFTLDKISLRELTPYIQEKVFVSLSDGYLSMKSKLAYQPSSKKPDLQMRGSLNLEEFFVEDSRDNTSLFAVSNLGLKSFTLEMLPNRMFIDEMDVDAFYVNAIIDEQKVMNFATLTKQSETNESVEIVEVIDENSTESPPAFPVKIMKINVMRGSANFADLSLPIKFQTNIHDLGGVVYAVSNEPGETSYIDILGEVDEYGSTKLKGSINSSNPKSYTDLDFNFRNLELSSYSGYSATFAGYEIDEGKLYLDLGYYILDSELLGKNSIMIKNIKLGKEVSDDTLPLGFVIALLEDSDGVIDIDMPVEGNVDEPDFKYGTLVMKTLGNLIVKAVTSPFRFLGSMMGMDSEELESLDFEPGLIAILPPEREKLDSITKMMIKRPKILLSIAGKYDKDSDRLALQKQKLASLVTQRSKSKNKKESESSTSIEVLEEIYYEQRDDKRLKTLKEELAKKYKENILERAYLIALTKECVAIQSITKETLAALATARVNEIKNYLVNEKMINSTRVKLKEVGVVEESDEKWVKTKLDIEVK